MKSSHALNLLNTTDILTREFYLEMHKSAQVNDPQVIALLNRCEESLREVAFLLAAIKKSQETKEDQS